MSILNKILTGYVVLYLNENSIVMSIITFQNVHFQFKRGLWFCNLNYFIFLALKILIGHDTTRA